jgi:hypothetical protein
MRPAQVLLLAVGCIAILGSIVYIASLYGSPLEVWVPSFDGEDATGPYQSATPPPSAYTPTLTLTGDVPVQTFHTTPSSSMDQTEDEFNKHQQTEEDRVKQEEEDRIKQEEERLKQEEEKRLKQEEEERLKQEEEGRLKQEEEDRIKQEEERLTPEEEERLRQQEEQRKKEEEEERIRKEEEDRKKKEEEEEIHNKYWAIREEMLAAENASLAVPILIPPEQLVNGQLEPSGKKILILTAHDGQGTASVEEINRQTMQNRDEYAAYHGYTHYFVNTTKFKSGDRYERPSVWFKMPAIKEAFDEHPEAEWVWWLDADAIIMNAELPIAEHFLSPYVLRERLTYNRPVNDLGDKFSGLCYPARERVDVNNIDIIFAQDNLGVNAGSFLIRRSELSSWLVDMWGDPLFIEHKFPREEQDAFIWLMMNHETIFNHMGLIPQRLINAYDNYVIGLANFRDGDFVIHFAGHNKGPGYQEKWDGYWERRTPAPGKNIETVSSDIEV